MAWKAYYRISDGRLLSVGDVHPEEVPTGVGTLDLLVEPGRADVWDETLRAYIPRPVRQLQDTARDRWKALRDHASFPRLNATEQANLKLALDATLNAGGRWRWR